MSDESQIKSTDTNFDLSSPAYQKWLSHQSAQKQSKPIPVLGDVLETAKNIINGERQQDYGDPSENFADIARLWSAHLGTGISAIDVCHLMILLKLCRGKNGEFKKDTYVDIAGYSAIASYLQEKLHA